MSDERAVEKVLVNNSRITVIISDSPSFLFLKFFFETTSGITLTLYFETKETIEKLLKAFFIEVKKHFL